MALACDKRYEMRDSELILVLIIARCKGLHEGPLAEGQGKLGFLEVKMCNNGIGIAGSKPLENQYNEWESSRLSDQASTLST